MPKFRRAQGAEFLSPAKPKSTKVEATSTTEANTDQGAKLAEFYASLVETSGQPWASQLPHKLDAKQAAQQPQRPSSLHHNEESLPEQAHSGGQIRKLDQESIRASVNTIITATASDVIIIPPGQCYPEPAGPSLPPETTIAASSSASQQASRIVISDTSIGYKLLEKAGWKKGTGIGAREQGRQEPIQTQALPDKVGLGFASKVPHTSKAIKHSNQAARGAGSIGVTLEGDGIGKEQHAKRELPEDPLDKEDLDTKVKRVRQVMQAEADDKAAKAISRYVYSAFRDGNGEPTSDSNPLLRRNKLSRTNPLL